MSKAKIILLSPAYRGKEFELTRDLYICGRISERDIEIPDVTISSTHCTFAKKGDTYELTDNHSTNGTRVNGEKITTPVLLKHTDILTIGMVEALFECSNGAITNTGKASVTTRINISNDMQKTVPCITANFSPNMVNKSKQQQTPKFFIAIIAVLAILVLVLALVVVLKLGAR